MRAIIPVAGIGSRLRPHTYTLPKVMLNVAGKPIIGHIMDHLRKEQIDHATVIVGYMGEKVRTYLGKHYPDINVTYVEQEERLGLGHSIYIARETLGDEPALIILGDTVFDVDLAGLLECPHSALGVKEVEDPRRFGVAETAAWRITRLVEKPEVPTTNLALVGLYLIRNTPLLKECLTELVEGDHRTRGEYQLTDALQMMIDRGETFVPYHVVGWYDCGKPETLLETNQHLLQQQADRGQLPPVDGQVHGSVIIPPVFLGEGCRVTNSVVGPFATIAENAQVSDSVVRDSIIGDSATVAASMLERSLVGANATILGRFRRINVGDSTELDFR